MKKVLGFEANLPDSHAKVNQNENHPSEREILLGFEFAQKNAGFSPLFFDLTRWAFERRS